MYKEFCYVNFNSGAREVQYPYGHNYCVAWTEYYEMINALIWQMLDPSRIMWCFFNINYTMFSGSCIDSGYSNLGLDN